MSAVLPRRIPQLDGLRGLAILFVLAFHTGPLLRLPAWALDVCSFGWSGVDLFFVLSGFLIGGILIDQRESPNLLPVFYARRFFRIVPLYLGLVALYAVLWQSGVARAGVTRYLFPPMPWPVYLSFTSNFWIALRGEMGVFLAPTWSLSVEEQFYLCLPWVVRFVSPRRLLAVVAGLAAAVALARATAGAEGWVTQNQLYVLPVFREDALLAGVLVAILLRSREAHEWLRRNPWMPITAIGFCAALLLRSGVRLGAPGTLLMRWGLSAVALGYAATLVLAITQGARLHWLTWRPLTEVGKVSYFLYLTHVAVIWPLHLLLPKEWGSAALTACYGVALAALFGLAQLSWRLFESPMIRLGHRFRFLPAREVRVEASPAIEFDAA